MNDQPPSVPPPPQDCPASPLPTASLVLGILGLCCLGPLASIPAIVCGHLARARLRSAGHAGPEHAKAVAGLALGYGGIVLQAVLAAILFVLSAPGQRMLSGFLYPVSYEFVIAPQLDEVPPDRVPPALARLQDVLLQRLHAAGVPARAVPPDELGRVRLQVGRPPRVPIEEIRALVSHSAYLEFRLVHQDNDDLTAKLFDERAAPDGYRIAEIGGASYYERSADKDENPAAELAKDTLRRFGVFGPAYEFMLEETTVAGRTVFRPHIVSRRAEMNGEHIESARVEDDSGTPVVSIEFDAAGAKKFAAVTGDYAPGGARNPDPARRRRLAIVLDGRVCSAPSIMEAIQGGRAQISGRFTPVEARYLANALNAGAFPVPVLIASESPLSP